MTDMHPAGRGRAGGDEARCSNRAGNEEAARPRAYRTGARGLAAALFALAALGASAQVTVEKPSLTVKTRVDLSGLQVAGSDAGLVFRKTLESDLMRWGWFDVAAPGRGELRLTGACADAGGSLEVRCSALNAQQRPVFEAALREPRDRARLLAHRLSDAMVKQIKGKPGVACTRLAVVGTVGSAKELFLCDSDGGNMVQLTQDRSISAAPAWNPRRPEIYYTSYCKGFPDIYAIDLASMRRGIVAGFPGLNTGAAVSPDGRELAMTLSKDGNVEVYVMGIGSRNFARVTRTLDAAEASPSWSPDGRQIACVSDSAGSPQIYVMDRAGGARRRLTYHGRENVSPDWGPGGLIAFCSLRGRYGIYVMDPQSGEERMVASEGGADFERPSWAPDGRHIACTRSERYRPTIYVLDILGDAPIRLSNVQNDLSGSAWSRE